MPDINSLIGDLIKIADELDFNGYFELSDKIDEFVKTACINRLVVAADMLDNEGFNKFADIIDKKVSILCQAENHGFFPTQKSNKTQEESPIKILSEISLSTRYCPDHRGVQAIRIDDNTYQCPLDGKMYNYETGYVDYKGQRVPGGSISAQTPSTSDYGGVPMRVYDSRSDVLNRIN